MNSLHPQNRYRPITALLTIVLLSLALLVLPIVTDYLGITPRLDTAAQVSFPRVATLNNTGVWDWTCPAGYWVQAHSNRTNSRENTRWWECVNDSFNNPVPPWKPPVGNHDQSVCPGTVPNSSSNVITGWACDPNNWNTALQVQVYRDAPRGSGGTYVGQVTANQNRADVAGSCGGTTNHGFTFQIPEEMRDNVAHNYYVYAIDDGSFGNAGDPLLGGSPKAATCTIPPPTGPSASCIYNPARNLFEAEYRWTAPAGYNTFYTRIGDVSGNLATNPGWRDDIVGTTHRFDLSNSAATVPGFTADKNFTYWIHTRWLHPSDPNNASLWRWSAAVPVAPNNGMTCPLPAPLTPTTASASCTGSFTSTNGAATFNVFAEFSARYNIEYTQNGGTAILIENQPALVSRNLPWGRYTWRVQGENLTDRRGPWQIGNNFECRPPDPVVTLSASPALVTRDSATTLNWTIQANYPVNCTVTGGGTTRAVSHTGTPLQTSGTLTTGAITNTTDFRFECTPNIPALPGMPSVEQTTRVEVVPVIEER